jgi:hypothetical protein
MRHFYIKAKVEQSMLRRPLALFARGACYRPLALARMGGPGPAGRRAKFLKGA